MREQVVREVANLFSVPISIQTPPEEPKAPNEEGVLVAKYNPETGDYGVTRDYTRSYPITYKGLRENEELLP
jgi:hypothetical protein